MLRYEQTTEQDLSEMARMFRQFLNNGEGVEAYLREGLQTPGYIGVKCMDDDTMVAVLTAKPGVEFTCPKPALCERIARRWPGKKIYTGEMVTVLPAYRGRGIAKAMTLRWADAMRRLGGEYLMLELWHKKDGDEPASGMLKYIGEVEASWSFPRFYADLGRYGMTCPDCAPGPCTCGATVVILRL